MCAQNDSQGKSLTWFAPRTVSYWVDHAFFRNQLFPRGNRGGVTQYPLNLDFSPDVKTPTYPHIPVFYHTTQKPSNGIGFLKTPWATILCKHGIKAQGQIFVFKNIRDTKFDKIGYLKGYSNIKNALLIIFSLFLPFGEKKRMVNLGQKGGNLPLSQSLAVHSRA